MTSGGFGRRRWLQGAGALGLVGTTGCARLSEPGGVFSMGVASADPLADRVLLWTRVNPAAAGDGQHEVRWTVSPSVEPWLPVAAGTAWAEPTRDHTLQVDASGLEPATTYYYRFEAAGEVSPIGRTRTLPREGTAPFTFAMVSCASYAHGFFHVYRHLAERADLDAVLHLGDSIYEYGTDTYGSRRACDPPHELLTLDDYRRRHRQYRRDADWQAVHQQHPFLYLWDDHELANNTFAGGALEHDPLTEGAWAERRAAAVRAFFEYTPVRSMGERIWRAFRIGDLAELLFLDTRLWARDRQVDTVADDLGMPGRELLGAEQMEWLASSLERDGRWSIVAQQIPFSGIRVGPDRNWPFNLDQWDGYTAARLRLVELLAQQSAPVLLSGDIHSHWAMEVATDPFDGEVYDPASGRGAVGLEVVTSSVTTPTWTGTTDSELIALAENELRHFNPHVRHLDFGRRGWVELTLETDRIEASFWVVGDVEALASEARPDVTLEADRGVHRWRPGSPTPRVSRSALAPGAPAPNWPGR